MQGPGPQQGDVRTFSLLHWLQDESGSGHSPWRLGKPQLRCTDMVYLPTGATGRDHRPHQPLPQLLNRCV